MRAGLLLLALTVGACAPKDDSVGMPRPEVLRDVESYAIASCLAFQSEPYLKDQGDAWASVVVQRAKGDVELFAAVAEQVKIEHAKGEMPVVRSEGEQGKDKVVPVLYCGEIIDKPAVRAAIQKAIAMLAPAYTR